MALLPAGWQWVGLRARGALHSYALDLCYSLHQAQDMTAVEKWFQDAKGWAFDGQSSLSFTRQVSSRMVFRQAEGWPLLPY